jgi:hypothetical protein
MIANYSLPVVAILLVFNTSVLGQQSTELMRIKDKHARQAVAADEDHIYVIDNSIIVKRAKATGKIVHQWEDTTGTITHLNSGVVRSGKLYCASSNYPHVPMVSSIEIFDADNLEHIASHPFGIYAGSCTWIDRYKGYWYVFFAHYENNAQSEGKGVEWSTLIKFDDQWRRVCGYTLPASLIEKIRPYSLSGGIIMNDQVVVTGHHEQYIYLLNFPVSGAELKLVKEVPVQIRGQGISVDPDEETIFWGIDRQRKEVIRFSLDF